jgi:hypothetical protein
MKHLLRAFLLSLPLLGNAAELNLPLLPAEAKIIQGIAATEGVEVVLGSKPGFSARGAAETLAGLGVPRDDIASVTVQSKERDAVAFTVTHDKAGHVLAITGNGSWLRNSTLRSFKALVAHSLVTDAGVAFFAGHSGLTNFSVSEMGKPLLTGKALASIAKIPNVNKIGLGECYITYTDGFAHLALLKDKLLEFNITMSIASPADLDKFKADHPKMIITGLLTPEEIVKRHSGAAANIARHAPPELATPLKAAIAQFRKK